MMTTPLTKRLVALTQKMRSMGISNIMIVNTINLLRVLPNRASKQAAISELEKLAKVQTNDRDWAYDSGQIIKKYLKVL